MALARRRRVHNKAGVEIPALPSTLAEVIQLRRQGQAREAQDRLCEIIQRDAVMSAYVLKRVNSAYHGLARNISQIDRAITLLGFMPVCNIVFMQGLRKAFAHLEDSKVGDIYAYIMKTSTAAAAFGRELAVCLNPDVPDTTFAAGLLHQLGRLVLLASVPERYAPLWYHGGAGLSAPLIPQEHARLRTDYVAVGEMVAQRWQLPEELVIVIRHHQNPTAVQMPYQRAITHFVVAGRHAAVALYDPHRQTQSTFFGLSPALVELARIHKASPRKLVEIMVERRETIRSYADAILG